MGTEIGMKWNNNNHKQLSGETDIKVYKQKKKEQMCVRCYYCSPIYSSLLAGTQSLPFSVIYRWVIWVTNVSNEMWKK